MGWSPPAHLLQVSRIALKSSQYICAVYEVVIKKSFRSITENPMTSPRNDTTQHATVTQTRLSPSSPGAVSSVDDRLSSLTLQSPPRPNTTPFGTLEILPPEVRANVFQHCIINASISILRCSKALHAEFIPQLHEGFELEILVDPTAVLSSMRILNQRSRFLYCLSNHRDGTLDAWPVDRFKGLKTVVEAPDPSDPGQLVRCWTQVTSLVSSLSPRWRDPAALPKFLSRGWDVVVGSGRLSRKLPPVTIEFRDVENCGDVRRWTSDSPYKSGERLWNHSVPSYNEWNSDEHWDPNLAGGAIRLPLADPRRGFRHSDVDINSMAFSRIRKAERLELEFPANWALPEDKDGDVQSRIRLLKQFNKLYQPFGCCPSREDGIDDDLGLSSEDAMHLWLDYLLDDLQGFTAAILRRQRWQAWCCEHEQQMGLRFNGFRMDRDQISHHGNIVVGGPKYLHHPGLVDVIREAFCDRFLAGYRIPLLDLKLRPKPEPVSPTVEHVAEDRSAMSAEDRKTAILPDSIYGKILHYESERGIEY